MHLIITAVLSAVVDGLQWRMSPREGPKWKSIYHDFWQWHHDSTWRPGHDTLRIQVHQRAGPSILVKGGAALRIGCYDAAKQVNGRNKLPGINIYFRP